MARNNVWRYTLCSLYIFGHLGKNIKKGKRCQEDCKSYLFGSKQGDWASKGRLIHPFWLILGVQKIIDFSMVF